MDFSYVQKMSKKEIESNEYNLEDFKQPDNFSNAGDVAVASAAGGDFYHREAGNVKRVIKSNSR